MPFKLALSQCLHLFLDIPRALTDCSTLDTSSSSIGVECLNTGNNRGGVFVLELYQATTIF